MYMRFENGKQVEITTIPQGEGWYELPKNFDWQKRYCLTEGGEIVERSVEDIQKDLLDNAKLCALDSIRFYFDNYTYKYSGSSHQKAKSYQIQTKAAEKILVAEEAKQQLNSKDVEIIDPLARVRGITIIEMAKLIQGKAQKAVKAIAKCEEIEDLAKKKIKEVKSEKELQEFLNDLKEHMEDSLANYK
ncbi:hypothetical protein [Wolbachia endosymbiont of Folsomia candida]|uniref:hypothetical protein n=1 Tax=Wolbachia endosymbiont of Folsomia candida TaxID=169402 RepID=UPI000B27B240|nr:hypothetical protein [Wolbachia endosymbiont of Folsomia candida]APR98633.1 hypothetical protein ASM33_05285 [Wolbachia endosymbiont of Folsomia candida]